jgi:DNA-binding transcriptional LysR family regulator
MNLNHLAIFHAVAEEGSVTRAAERLHISQPAVSKTLRELETSLGMALFHRLSKGVRLTDAGEILRGYARQIFELENEAGRALSELRELERGRLSVGASTTIGVYLLPELCAAFRNAFPGIEMRLEIANTAQIQRRLIRNEFDLALTEGFVAAADIQAEVLGHDDIICIAPRGHILLNEKEVDIARVLREPLLWREAGSGTRAVVEQALSERNLIAQPLLSLGSTEAIKRAVAAGSGLAFVSHLTVENELKNGELAQVPLCDFSIRRSLQRLRVKGKYEGRAVREFLRMLRPFARQKCPQ